MNKVSIFWHDYKYFPYERVLAHRELTALADTQIEEANKHLTVVLPSECISKMSRLTYFRGVQTDTQTLVPDQARLEASASECGQYIFPDMASMPSARRQNTRYSAHGLHEYRGKFNPQVVRAVGNLLGLNPGDWVLDPFCGSGTTLLEAAHIGWNCLGLDVNPLGVLIANAKVRAFTADPAQLAREAEQIIFRLEVADCTDRDWHKELPNADYLAKWFPIPVLPQLAAIVSEIQAVSTAELWDVFRVVLSDICRSVSLQDPDDLRIRRRKDPMPTYDAISVFTQALRSKVACILRARKQILPHSALQKAMFVDSRNSDKAIQEVLQQNHRPYVDAALCSPPYVTALPYIDTQRLSLCLLGLISSEEIRDTERTLIGNREISDTERVRLEQAITTNAAQLPGDVSDFCLWLLEAADHKEHGFRRRNVPGLAYKYFSQMAEMFEAVHRVVRPGGKYALLVGSNRTTLNSQEIEIDTPRLLASVAQSRGWNVEELIEFDTYQRYDAHQKNSIRHEMLVILRNR